MVSEFNDTWSDMCQKIPVVKPPKIGSILGLGRKKRRKKRQAEDEFFDDFSFGDDDFFNEDDDFVDLSEITAEAEAEAELGGQELSTGERNSKVYCNHIGEELITISVYTQPIAVF